MKKLLSLILIAFLVFGLSVSVTSAETVITATITHEPENIYIGQPFSLRAEVENKGEFDYYSWRSAGGNWIENGGAYFPPNTYPDIVDGKYIQTVNVAKSPDVPGSYTFRFILDMIGEDENGFPLTLHAEGYHTINVLPLLTVNPPAAPTVDSINSTSIILVSVPYVEYQLGDGAWQPSPEFTGLNPNTEYTFYARLAKTPTTQATLPSAGLVVRTTKQPAPLAPAIPTAASITATSVTLTPVPGTEYRNGSGEWQTSPEFSGLNPNTEYTFYVRLSETQTALASLQSELLTVKTDSVPVTPEIPVTGERQDGVIFRIIVSLLMLAVATRLYQLTQKRREL